MKKLNFSFIMMMAIGLFFAACTKEDLSTTTTQADEVPTAKQIIEDLQPEMDEYLVEHPDAHIEYTSLENLNQALVAEGLDPITLEEIGVTQEAYDNAQASINNPEAATERCTGQWAVLLGDMSGNSVLTTFDIVLARRCALGLGCVNPQQFIYYGYLSVFFGLDGFLGYSGVDDTTATQIILGILPCM